MYVRFRRFVFKMPMFSAKTHFIRARTSQRDESRYDVGARGED